jgi:hypothetical protein
MFKEDPDSPASNKASETITLHNKYSLSYNWNCSSYLNKGCWDYYLFYKTVELIHCPIHKDVDMIS